MFNLFELSIMSEIDRSENESDIIETIADCFAYNPDCSFLIRKNNINYRTIRNVNDYLDYVENYNKRIKGMSAINLKRDIVNKIR